METRQAHSVILSMLLVRQRLVTIITYGFFARNVTTSNSFARFLRGREAVFPSNPVDERLSPFFLSHPRDIYSFRWKEIHNYPGSVQDRILHA